MGLSIVTLESLETLEVHLRQRWSTETCTSRGSLPSLHSRTKICLVLSGLSHNLVNCLHSTPPDSIFWWWRWNTRSPHARFIPSHQNCVLDFYVHTRNRDTELGRFKFNSQNLQKFRLFYAKRQDSKFDIFWVSTCSLSSFPFLPPFKIGKCHPKMRTSVSHALTDKSGTVNWIAINGFNFKI